MIVILAGSIGRFPVGGHAWVDMQYLLGLRALGHDVYYLEDCGEGSWVYNWHTKEVTTDLEYPTAFLRDCLTSIGFDGRWLYRAGDQFVGMPQSCFRDLCSEADLMIIRGVPLLAWRSEYDCPRRRIFIDSDPGFTQISLEHGHSALKMTVERCERLFTIGCGIGTPQCPIPTAGRKWSTIMPPVHLPHWPVAEGHQPTYFTSIMQWRSYPKGFYKNVQYGDKQKEFPQFIDLPTLTGQPLLLALIGGAPDELSAHGWHVISGAAATLTPNSYRAFINNSRAEFGVAKEGYVHTRSGWFSDRSVCYLASGRPVLVQDTGQSEWIQTGEGLLTFRTLTDALDGIDAINNDYERQRRAARVLAERHFAAERVLPRMVEEALE
jgi:hypothetical protein